MSRSLYALSVLGLSVVTTLALADPVTVQGSNTLRYEHYRNAGDPNNSPFGFTGDQGFDEFNINARQNLTQYSQWQAQITGVYNESDFRSQHLGELLVERWNVKGESGDAALPVRAEIGDYQAFFSLGTLQRSLKGAQIELQPDFGGKRQHSVQVIAGFNEPDWRKLNANEDRTLGLSWFVRDETLGDFSINWMNNRRTLDEDLNQNTLSIAGHKKWAMLKRQWDIESELSHFSGDTNNTPEGENRSDNGYSVRLSGKQAKGKGNYRFRFEQYGEDYVPNGAVVSRNRRSIEAHSSWRFDSGLQARGRAQHFRNALESDNAADTRTVGLTLSGNLLGKKFSKVNGSVAGFVQLNDDEDETVNRRTDSLNVNLSFPIRRGWTGRSAASWLHVDDRIGAGSRRSQNYTLGVSHKLDFYGFTGQLSPTATFRKTVLATATNYDSNVALAANISKGKHRLSLSSGFNFNRPEVADDVDGRNLAFNYRYQRDTNTLGVEFTQNYRDPVDGESSTGDKVSIFWTHSFDKTLERRRIVRQAKEYRSVSRSGGYDDLNIVDFSVGRRLADIGAFKAQSFSEIGNFLVSETSVFSASDQRQRLVIKPYADAVEFAVVIIDFDDTGSLNSTQQIFEEMRRALVNQYGAPDSFFDRGEFDADFVQQLNSNGFIRIMEWRKGGGVLRFGIPQRLDGAVRMELHFASGFSPQTDTFWSIEEIQ